MPNETARHLKLIPLATLLAIALAILIGARTATALAQSSDPTKKPDARYDYRRWNYKVKGDNFTLVASTKLTVYNRRGDKYAHLTLGTNAFTKLKKAETKITDTRGKVIFEGNQKNLKKICGYGSFGGYSDNCTYTIDLKASRYPYTVEWEYRLDSKSLFFLRGQTFQSMIPVSEASFTLEVPLSLEFQSKVYGLELEPQLSEKKNKSTYVWQATDIPPLKDIERVPPGENDFIRLALCVSRFDLEKYKFNQLDWQHVGLWYNQMAADRYSLTSPPELNSVADQLETARTIYNEVIADVRYVAIEIGVGGWQPYPADLTAKRAWGDCKDMSTLLIARLREQNIQALPALVLTRSAGPIDADFPSFGFNHLIAAALVGNDTIWMDPTCSRCPFGDIPGSVEDIDLLLISDEGGAIVRTPLSKAEENRIVRHTTWRLEDEDLVSFNSRLSAYGNKGTNFRYRLEGYNSDQQRQYAERQFRGVPNRLKTTSFSIDLPDSLEAPVTITLSGQAVRPSDRVDDNLYVAMMQLIGRSAPETVDFDDRLLPIDIGYPFQIIDSIQLILPSDQESIGLRLPDSDSLQTPFGHFYITTSQTDSLATIIVEKEYSVTQIESEQLPEFAAFVDSLKDWTRIMTRVRIK